MVMSQFNLVTRYAFSTVGHLHVSCQALLFTYFTYFNVLTDHQRVAHVDLSFPPSCPALLHH